MTSGMGDTRPSGSPMDDTVGPQNVLLPAGLRQRDQTQKSPTGPLDREALLQHLEKQALEAGERDDLVPFTGEKKGVGTRGGGHTHTHTQHTAGTRGDRAAQRRVYLAQQNGPRQQLGCPGRAGSLPAPGTATPWQCHPPYGHPCNVTPSTATPGNATPPYGHPL